MKYISTRGEAPAQSFCDILLGGLAPDGGLYLPGIYPQVSAAELAEWRGLPYHALALKILQKFVDDIPACDLEMLADRTYSANVYRHCRPGHDAGDITPLTTLEPGFHLLELSNGPTLAFKDMAMQLLGHLFEYVLEKRGETINILGATSGDTGSAAEYAMRGKHRVKVFMLSPEGKMSAFQRAQMFSLQEPNIFNIAVRGMFDDAQDIVKAVSNDAGFKARYRIGAVNSINWARVMAQVVYYFKGYFAATASNAEEVAFCVPSGNFGNICAGHIARHDGPADHPPGAGDQRKRCTRRVLPQRGVSAARDGGNPCHLEPVDGHFEGLQFRALRLRPGRPRCRPRCATCGARWMPAAPSTCAARRIFPPCRTTASFPDAACMRTGSRPSAMSGTGIRS
jgi:threonine synthase